MTMASWVSRLAAAAWLIGWGSTPAAYGYPEMVRHGYVNCTACHISPNGGGILNAYGRVQAEEVLSTWSREGEAGPLHGQLDLPERLSLGGQFRALQLWADNAQARSGRFIWMQADAELALHLGQWDVVATAGFQDVAGSPFISRRHYLLYRPSPESVWNWRAGKFQPAFGLALADHAIATRARIGFGQGAEAYAVEAARLGQYWDLFVTAVLGSPGQGLEPGFAVRSAINLASTYKIGLSAYHGVAAGAGRTVVGPFATLGFSPHSFLLGELVFQKRVGSPNWGPATYWRLDYEFHKGMHAYLTADFSRLDPAAPWEGAVGGGLQFFPRPHFEIRTEYNRRQDIWTQGVLTDYGWLMGHYYL